MRHMFLLIAALVIAASPARGAADWQEYVYPEDRFAIQFPSEPSLRTAPYETTITSGLSETSRCTSDVTGGTDDVDRRDHR